MPVQDEAGDPASVLEVDLQVIVVVDLYLHEYYTSDGVDLYGWSNEIGCLMQLGKEMSKEEEEGLLDGLQWLNEDDRQDCLNSGMIRPFGQKDPKSHNSYSIYSKRHQLQKPQFAIGRKRKKNHSPHSELTKSEYRSRKTLHEDDDDMHAPSRLSAKIRVFQPFVRDLIIKQPFLNQNQITNMIKQHLGMTIPQQTVSKILDSIGYTKKRRTTINIKGDTQQNKSLRYQYAKIYQQQLNERELLFMDEIGFSEIIERQFGYAPIGQPLVRQKRSLKKQVVTLSALMGYQRLHAWRCMEGPPRAADIAEMVQSLDDQFKDWFLILDNASIHKSYELRQVCIRKKIKILYLPPNSPQLNPVQLLFAQLKSVYRGMKYPQIKSINEMVTRTNQCCRKLQGERFWCYKGQIIYWIEKAIQRKNFFNSD